MEYEKPNFDYWEMNQSVMDAIRSHGSWSRVVSIDLETKITKRSDFLTGERLLAVGLARRQGNGVETRMFRLKDESDGAEKELLEETARWMNSARPLALVGYNISGYDFPLLALKLKWYDDYMRKDGAKSVFPKEYWALKDALTRAYILDVMHPLRFAIADFDKTTPKYKSLNDVVNHPLYSRLGLMRRKNLAAASTTEDKGRVIYELWKSNNPDFEKYLEGDVHDVLILAETLFGCSPPKLTKE